MSFSVSGKGSRWHFRRLRFTFPAAPFTSSSVHLRDSVVELGFKDESRFIQSLEHLPYLSPSTFRRTAGAQTTLLTVLQTHTHTHLFISHKRHMLENLAGRVLH